MPSNSSDRTAGQLPIDLNRGDPAQVLLEGGAATVDGTAEPRLGFDYPERQLIIFAYDNAAATAADVDRPPFLIKQRR